jgi:hypothetical protein
VTVDDLNVVVRRRVVERSAGVFGDEAEEFFPPWVIHKREESFAERLQLFDADCANGSGIALRRASVISSMFRFLGFMMVGLIGVFTER